MNGRQLPATPVPGLKPVPAIVTPVPEGPPVGLRVIAASEFDVTVKVALAVSPVPPVTVMVYTPGTAEVAIVNPLVTNWPLTLMLHAEATTMPGTAGACEYVHGPES